MFVDVTQKPRLTLRITAVRQLTQKIKAYQLAAIDHAELPTFSAGAHIKVPVTLADGKAEMHAYSICSDPQMRKHYEIAVLLESNSRGGSQFIHNHFQIGTEIECEAPTNYFHLHADSSPALLIAGGIGITPIKAMAHSLAARGRRFQLHYASKLFDQMAYRQELEENFPAQLFLYPSDQNKKLNVAELLESAPSNANIYVCGPTRLIEDVETTATLLGFSRDQVHSERFKIEGEAWDQDLILELARSKKIITVKKDQSLLSALRDADINAHYDCCVGECGTCAVKILEGEADHRDHVLSDALKEKGFICVCVSRSKSERLVLDL